MHRRTFIALTGHVAAVSLVATAAAAPSNAVAKRRIAPTPIPTALSLPNVTLRTQDNKKVKLYEDLLKNKIFLINMFFVACTDGQCPLVTANLARVQSLIGKRLGRDIFMYSISLDPILDTPESLKAYSTHFNVQPGWLFLTAENLPDVERLRKALGYWDPDPKVDAQKTTHTGIATMGNEALDRWVACPTLAEPREIKRVLSYLDWPKGWSRNHRAS
ncbi:MAG: SCO family protein [Gammaproteobacteria bacterium]|nr:SCO family protein [Gammaproteobacteria bacterium]